MHAYERERSETGCTHPLFLTATTTITPDTIKYHDFFRYWVIRGMQIRINLKFNDPEISSLQISPAFNVDRISPFAAKETEAIYTDTHAQEAFTDNWFRFSSITTTTTCESRQWYVRQECNYVRGLRIVCTFRSGYEATPGTILSMKGCRRASDQIDSGFGVEFEFPFRFDFRRIDYEKMELKAFDRLCKILDVVVIEPHSRA